MEDTHIIDRVSEEHLWDQVLHRQAGAEFLYAVTTMGVYCRPACPSPRPLRKNVRFFPAVSEAEAAGFRACKRCDPKGERARIAQDVVRDASAFIEASEEIPSLDVLAKRSGYSRFHFLRMFRDHTGLTPRSYAEAVRARRLHAALANGDRVVDAVAEAGFGSESRVYEKTASLLGMTPGAARRGGQGERIRTAFADCPFGRLLVGATDKGVCFIGFAEPDDALMADLRRRFPHAVMTTDDTALAGTVQAVLDFLRGTETGAGVAAGSARDRFPAAGVAHLVRHPCRRDADLCPTRGDGGKSQGGPRGGSVVRDKSGVTRGSVPSGGWQRWWADRVSLGRAAQEGVAGAGTEAGGGLAVDPFRSQIGAGDNAR